jgi:hypothetical protein
VVAGDIVGVRGKGIVFDEGGVSTTFSAEGCVGGGFVATAGATPAVSVVFVSEDEEGTGADDAVVFETEGTVVTEGGEGVA